MCGLDQEGLAVAKEKLAQRGLISHGDAQIGRTDPVTVPRYLHIGVMRRAVVAHDDHEAGHPLAADQSDLDKVTVPLGDNRSNPAFGEVDVADWRVRNFTVEPERKLSELEERLQHGQFGARQRRQ